MTLTVCPVQPCPNDPAFDVTFEVEEGSGGTRVLLIIVIATLSIFIIIVAVVLIKRDLREKCFRRFGTKTEVQYVDLDGKDPRTSPANRREPVKQTDIIYSEDTANELNMDLQLAPSAPDVTEYEPVHKQTELAAKPKPRVRKAKERTSLKYSFTDIDKYNAFNDKGKQDNENLVEINANDLIRQDDEMRKVLRQHKESLRIKDGWTKKRPASRQRNLSGNENVAFTNEHLKTGPLIEPETADDNLNEMRSRLHTPEPASIRKVPETLVVASHGRRHRHSSRGSDRSWKSHEGRDSRSSRGDRQNRSHGERREHRRRKDGNLGESMKSTDSAQSTRSKRRHLRRSRHSDAPSDRKTLVMTDITLCEFTSMEPIDELGGSLV